MSAAKWIGERTQDWDRDEEDGEEEDDGGERGGKSHEPAAARGACVCGWLASLCGGAGRGGRVAARPFLPCLFLPTEEGCGCGARLPLL
jgi:hypothetical protein